MSFTAQDILTEFAEASRYGRRDSIAWAQVRLEQRVERWNDSRREYQRSWRFRAWRRRFAAGQRVVDRALRVTYAIAPVDVLVASCPTCGGRLELREGSRRATHIGRHCTRGAA